MPQATPLFRAAVPRSPDVTIRIDGQPIQACAGETLIAALLLSGQMTGRSEFDDGERAGFCLMGACQDCTLWTRSGKRLRACMTEVAAGMDLCRKAPIEGPVS